MDDDHTYSKIQWRCRRGTKELDVILARFVDNCYASLSSEEKKELSMLLDLEDPLLTDWLCHGVVPKNQGMVNIVSRVLSAG